MEQRPEVERNNRRGDPHGIFFSPLNSANQRPAGSGAATWGEATPHPPIFDPHRSLIANCPPSTARADSIAAGTYELVWSRMHFCGSAASIWRLLSSLFLYASLPFWKKLGWRGRPFTSPSSAGAAPLSALLRVITPCANPDQETESIDEDKPLFLCVMILPQHEPHPRTTHEFSDFLQFFSATCRSAEHHLASFVCDYPVSADVAQRQASYVLVG